MLAAYALAAGNAMVYKPSEYTPGVSQWLADRFAEVVPEHPVLQVVQGLGDTGAALCRSGVDKVAFIGSTATAKQVMATCAQSLTPVLAEGGGKDAMIVEADADLDAAAEAALWGGLCNTGQTCTGIECLCRLRGRRCVHPAARHRGTEAEGRRRRRRHPGPDHHACPVRHDPPAHRRRGGRWRHGDTGRGRSGAAAVCAADHAEEGIARANALPYALGGSVFARRRGLELARRMRSGMPAVNSVLSFAAMPSLPSGGVGDSGFGRIHGDDGLREFARPKAITTRRTPSPLPAWTFARDPDATARRVVTVMRLLHGRSRLPHRPSPR